MTSRRGFLLGLGAALAAPAVVRAESLMKIASLRSAIVADPVTLTEVTLRAVMDQISQSLAMKRMVRDAIILGSASIRVDDRGVRNIDPWDMFAK